MKIIRLDKIDSTHTYLKEYIKKHTYTEPICIVTFHQTHGIGSRGNSWTGVNGNLFFSFIIDKNLLAQDLPIQSASIYFSYLLKEVFEDLGSKVWLKWPNDFYIDEKKIGGTITTISKDLVFCGIGINLISVNDNFGKLDINIDINEVLKKYFSKIKKKILWKHIFKYFKIEFVNSQEFQVTIDNQKISLKNAKLNDDGSIELNNKKVFSLR